MSGHSKWATIKHKKGAADKARGKLFAKLARQIEVAAKSGGDVDTNATLRTAVQKAKAAPDDQRRRSTAPSSAAPATTTAARTRASCTRATRRAAWP